MLLSNNKSKVFLLIVLLLLPVAILADDADCFACHSEIGLTKTLGDNEQLSLYINSKDFAASAHAKKGCKACHKDAIKPSHPIIKNISNSREYAGEASQVCRKCHKSVFKAYSKSMHGISRIENNNMRFPICSDCHQVHSIQSGKTSDMIKEACFSCHTNALAAHKEWLPNATLHMKIISCPACHSSLAERSIDLRLYNGKTEAISVENSIPENKDGLNSTEIREIVQDNMTLNGRLEVLNGKEVHELSVKIDAVRDCTTCHQLGAEVYENTTLSIIDESGKRIKYDVDDDILVSATTIDTIGGFYTAGGTRIKLLDYLFVLSIISGLWIILFHWILRKYFKNRS